MKIGRYEIIQKIGSGAFGVVWKGHDPLIQRFAAIKVMSEAQVGNKELVERFFREARTAGQMQHVNIVTIHDLGEHEGKPFIAMEFLEGTDLEEIILKAFPLPIPKKIDIIRQVAQGLQYAHQRGIIHRDIKPSNIRILDDGVVKIMDFGIAKVPSSEATRTGQFIGTVSYMSPEQFKTRRVDARSDLFSLGVMSYELLTLRKPFPGDSITAILFKIVNEPPLPMVEVHDPQHLYLEKIVFKLLEKNPDKRFQSALDLLHALEFPQMLQAGAENEGERAELALTLCKRYADQGDLDTALTIIDQSLNFAPNVPEARKVRDQILAGKKVKEIRKLLDEGRPEEAQHVLDDTAKTVLDPAFLEAIQKDVEASVKRHRVDKLLQKAAKLMAEKRYEQAIATLEEVLVHDAYNTVAREQLDHARDELRKLEITDQVEKAKADLRLGKVEKARGDLERLLKTDPHNRDIRALIQQIDTERRLIEQRSKADELLHGGSTALSQGRVAEAVQAFEQVIAINPTHEKAGELLARARAEQQRVEQERQVAALLAAGRSYLEQRRFEAAAQQFKKARELQPTNPEIPVLLEAASKHKRGLGADAGSRKWMVWAGIAGAVVVLAALAVAVALLLPGKAERAMSRADKLAASGALTDGYQGYLGVLEMDPGPRLERKVRKALLGLAPRLVEKGNLVEGRDIYARSLREWTPGDPAALEQIKAIPAKLADRGDLEEADRTFETIHKIDPRDFDLMEKYTELGSRFEARAASSDDLERKISDLMRARVIYTMAAEVGAGRNALERVEQVRKTLFALQDDRQAWKDLTQGIEADLEQTKALSAAPETYPQALEMYRRVVERIDRAPESLKPRFASQREKAMAEVERLRGAFEAYKKGRTAEQTAGGLLESARTLAAQGDIPGAMRLLEQTTKLPGVPAALSREASKSLSDLRGRVNDRDRRTAEARSLIGRGQYAASLAILEAVGKDFPRDIEIQQLTIMARAGFKGEQDRAVIDKAIADAQGHEASRPDDALSAYDGIASKYDRGLTDDQRKRIDDGRTRVSRTRRADDITRMTREADAALAAGDRKKALRILRTLQKNYLPGDGELQKRIRDIEGTEEKRPSAVDLLAAAKALVAEGKLGEAAGKAEEVLKIDPGNREARAIIDSARAPAPPKADPLSRAVQEMEAAFAAGRHADTVELADAVLKIDPGHAGARERKQASLSKLEEERRQEARRTALVQEASAAIERGELDEAERRVDEILGLDAAEPRALDLKKQIAEKRNAAARRDTLGAVRSAAQSGSFVDAARRLDEMLAKGELPAGKDDLVAVVYYNVSLDQARAKDCVAAARSAARAKEYASAEAAGSMDRWFKSVSQVKDCKDFMFQSLAASIKRQPLP